MALFDQYTKPGVYTSETVADPGIILFGDLRIPIFIGEGQETFSLKNQEMHRGSSAVADDLVVKENISDQITGFTRQFQLGYFPVVKGDGTGTTTSTPVDITVLADGAPATVTSLNGTTGVIQLHDIYVPGTTLEVTYFFKRKDTYISSEDLSDQVPVFATWTYLTNLALSLSVPGASGNLVSLGVTSTASATDALAVSGVGTDTLSIELRKPAHASTATGSLTFASVAKTVLRTTGSWLNDGVAVGDKVTFSSTASNNSTFTVTIATADTLTFGGDTVATEVAASASVSIVELRNLTELAALLAVGIPTLSSGNIVLSSITAGHENDPGSTQAPSLFRNGAGPNSNVTFKTEFAPIVDGSNGGVVTTSVSKVAVKVNGLTVGVKSVDGISGFFTLNNPVLAGQTLTISYYTNNYQDTYDILPASNIDQINLVGFGPDRDDFINGVDFVLETPSGKNARIQWGASSSTDSGVWTAGYVPFDASVITTTLVDERMYLQPVQGTVDGKNAVFTLLDVPTDGSGLARETNDPALISVYLGVDPITALNAGPVRVIQLTGATKTFKLYNPPSGGSSVFASYYRNTLNDHSWTLTVVNPGITGQGTYNIQNELNQIAPVVLPDVAVVTEANYAITGTVWPYSFSDLTSVAGDSPDETVTLTFQDDNLQFVVTPAVQATLIGGGNTNLRFRATTPGSGPNSVVSVQFIDGGGTGAADLSAVTYSSDTVTVNILKVDNITVRTLQEIINLFSLTGHIPTRPTTGVIICEPINGSVNLTTNSTTGASVLFTSGAPSVTTPYSVRYKVTSSRTSGDMIVDGLGRTGGAVTPGTSNVGGNAVGSDGYLDQTYADAVTGVRFTIINPADALSFGYTSLPSPSYHFRPGDMLTFSINSSTSRVASSIPTVDIFGLRTKVVSTYGMRTGDTAVINTFNKAGAEPHVGDFYYVTYTTHKTDADLALRLFTNPADAYALYGDPNPDNKLSLAARLFSLNGGQVFGAIQVRKDVGLETASDQAFEDAIASLASPLPGSDRKCDIIQPLTTSPVVLQYLNHHLISQASPRNSGEAVGFFGYDFYATPNTMRNFARGVKSERMIGISVPGAILEIDVAGKTAEFAVGGEFLAAAMAGMSLDPAIDVATTLTRKSMVGFSRLIRRYDDPTMDLMAADGLTCLVENNGAFVVRHWVTTDNSSPLKREPTSRLIVDYVRKIVRRNLDQFIGRKLIQSAINSVSIVTVSTLKSLVEQEIIEGFKNLQVTRDDYDPTIVHVKWAMKPIFSLLWISAEITVTTRL
jgi:hypothetical protein